MIATGSHQKRSIGDQREHRAEHEHLVGQRIEEGAAAGGAVAAGELAVDAVGARRATIQRHREPAHDGPAARIMASSGGDDQPADA